jgi:Tfp pilus assembly protein PilN
MSELKLDFQPSSGVTLTGITMLSFAGIILLLTWIYSSRLSDELAAMEANASALTSGKDTYGSAGRTAHRSEKELRQEIDSANAVLRQLSVPWEAMFKAVEFSDGSTVTLLAMEPDIAKREVKINGETRNYKALMDYVTRLQEQPVFGTVNLRSHHVQLNDRQRPVRFSLYATWREIP